VYQHEDDRLARPTAHRARAHVAAGGEIGVGNTIADVEEGL
jgi:hypothetical protein